ncbi:hypothetical protein [Klebsiella aerogenes]|uniref:hypothetical protein n=1 Tax=Klebsiella aerogenes TaxID=548 RepID=UPI0034D302AC
MKVQIIDDRGNPIWSQDDDSEFTGTSTEYLKDGTQEKIVAALKFALACAKSLSGQQPQEEKWTISILGDRFTFNREVNGRTEESYAPVNREKATVFVAAIVQGFEPPRLITLADQGFQPPLTPQHSGKPVG